MKKPKMKFLADELKLSRNEEYSRLLLRLIKSESDVVPLDVFNIILTDGGKFRELVRCFGVNALLDDDNSLLTKLCTIDGESSAMKYLIDSGADLEFRFVEKHTALIIAVLYGQTKYVKLLIDAGAKIKYIENANSSPLMATCSPKSNIEIAKFLLERGADVNEITSYGTPLSGAARIGNLDLAKLFIERGADVNLRANGITPLMNAAGAGRREMVKFLLERGADINQLDRGGQPALTFAYNFSQLTIAVDLIKAGARCNIRDDRGKCPVDYLDAETRAMFEL